MVSTSSVIIDFSGSLRQGIKNHLQKEKSIADNQIHFVQIHFFVQTLRSHLPLKNHEEKKIQIIQDLTPSEAGSRKYSIMVNSIQKYSIKSLSNNDSNYYDLMKKIQGKAWTCEVKILNKQPNGKVVSAGLFNQEFEEYIFFSLPNNMINLIKIGQKYNGHISIGKKKKGGYRFEFNYLTDNKKRKKQPFLMHNALESAELRKHVISICKQYSDIEINKGWKYLLNNKTEICRYCYNVLNNKYNQKDTKSISPEINIPFYDRFKKIKALSSSIEILCANLRYKDIKRLYDLCRKLETVQWQKSMLDSQDTETTKNLKEKKFYGLIEKIGAGYAIVRSPFFLEALFLPREKLDEGLFEKNAKICFKVNIEFNSETSCPKFQPVHAVSSAKKRDTTGIVTTYSSWLSDLEKLINPNKPILIVPDTKHNDIRAFKKEIEELVPDNYQVYRCEELKKSMFPNIYSHLLEPCLTVIPKNNQSSLNHAFLKNATARFLFPLIADIEKNSWTVVMDETGPCIDHCKSLKNPSVMMAVIIPPGSKPPCCPIGYHSIDSDDSDSIKIRNFLLEDSSIFCVGWIYQSGVPYKSSDCDFGLHLQMWRNAIIFCLELIASSQAQTKALQKNPVHIYIENVQNMPAGSNVLDGFTFDLAEQMQSRKGWDTLDITTPRIIAKDEHPYMGYVDSLGHIFRMDKDRMTHETYKQASALLERKRTISLPYNAEALQNLSIIVRQSGESPYKTLLSIANSTEKHIRPYAGVILRNLARSMFSALNSLEIERICSAIQDSLSKTPYQYFTNSLLSECIDDSILKNYPVELKVTAYLNKLASANLKGNAVEAEKYLELINKDLVDITNKNILYRSLAQLIDYYQNCLNFDKAEEEISMIKETLMNDSKFITSAAHLLGANFLTVALSGRTKEAMEQWEFIFNLQQTTDDRLRYLTYKIQLFIDLHELDKAWSLLEMLKKNYAPLSDLCMNNYYLLAAILKLEAHKPGLTNHEKKILNSIQASHYHPGQLIAFWQFQLHKMNSEKTNISLVKSKIESSNSFRCNALRLINACLKKQLAHDGDCSESYINVEDLETITQNTPIIQRLFEKSTINKSKIYCYLAPLHFNFW
ncbi:hypothetical protein [Desulfonatronovibrio magnus]|uniref:hypothetical protein n=1 Tax=Desulfonatronovibrio magnus TaxID=698827 RepID=UPI0005EB3A38|nr:hypothetical protein [Desulfonatronovibrio magnus]